jgi:ubiquinone/menaquinone biosynthesis C-methylase UbiE
MSPESIDADAFKRFETAGWEEVARGYDTFFGPVVHRVVDALLDAAGVKGGVRVLDIATGPGYVAARAAERGASVVGVDIATQMVALATKLHPGIDFRRGDAEWLPFDEGSFQAVVGSFVVPHLGRPEQASAEFQRVLASAGRVALSTWDLPERARLIGVLVDAVERAGIEPIANIPVGSPFFRFADDQEFARLLGDAGFDHVEVRTIAFTHRVADSDMFWNGLLGGIVRVRALVLAQSEEMRTRIRAAFDELVREYSTPEGLDMPVSVKIASGYKSRSAAGRERPHEG